MTKSRAETINAMPPQLVADMYLYPTEKGGREHAVHPGWGCPCARSMNPEVVGYGTHEHPLICRDGWPQLTAPLSPGETRRAGFVFLSPEASEELREAGTFYLWEGRFIGEATVVQQECENHGGC